MMLADEDSSSDGSSLDSDESDDDFELLLLHNFASTKELGAHLSYDDISEDEFENLFR